MASPLSTTRLLCVFGTASDVGKSWIAAGLCRLLHQSGVLVAPFKAQNMSNNAGVTPDGLEMGRAQIVQAHAAGVVPHVDMNPILLKPNSDVGAQVIALGKVMSTMNAREYFLGDMTHRRSVVNGALERLMARYDVVVAEGAGSCAEVNLRARDLVNMPIAHHGDGRVLLVADIHKGGVFAQIVGTLDCMPERDRARVAGLIVNRFRGDPSLFTDGVSWLEQRTGLPVLGVVPWNPTIHIEREDGLAPDTIIDPPTPADSERFHAAVLRLPHIANFTDFDSLTRHGVVLHYLHRPRDLTAYDALIIPGTKNTRGDLDWLRRLGWVEAIADYEGTIVGLCGGYQMLGTSIDDPHGIEGEPGVTPGLGLLPVSTVMGREKVTRLRHGRVGTCAVEGYEIHVGQTIVDGEPMLFLVDGDGERPEGARHGRVMGTYLHGLFDKPGVVEAVLGPIRPDLEWPMLDGHKRWRDREMDALADHLRASLNLGLVSELVGTTVL